MRLLQQSVELVDKDYDFTQALKKIELAGRTCYKSEDLITEDSYQRFIQSLIKRGHESVIEHVSLSFKVVTNRAISHEIVRHRLASYSQESTRYCAYHKDKFSNELSYIMPSFVKDIYKEYNIEENRSPKYAIGKIFERLMNQKPEEDGVDRAEIATDLLVLESWHNHATYTEEIYFMLASKLPPDQTRGVLSNDLKTELIMTMNLRELRHFIKVRIDKAAHPQIRELAAMLLEILYEKMPAVFIDIYQEYKEVI